MSELDRFTTTHFADDDDWGAICRMGQEGDMMSFFTNDTTCPRCLVMLDDE